MCQTHPASELPDIKYSFMWGSPPKAIVHIFQEGRGKACTRFAPRSPSPARVITLEIPHKEALPNSTYGLLRFSGQVREDKGEQFIQGCPRIRIVAVLAVDLYEDVIK